MYDSVAKPNKELRANKLALNFVRRNFTKFSTSNKIDYHICHDKTANIFQELCGFLENIPDIYKKFFS
jgi:hypothetical protein